MKRGLLILAAAAAVFSVSPALAGGGWEPVEKVETYAVTGKTGIDLYRSIGENGPNVGIGRAIAYTTFDLKWSRDYVPESGGCRLARARPWLTVIYRLPKPSRALPADTQRLWDTFISGIRKHERVHGKFIVEMVKKIEAYSVGLAVADDPDCKKIRQVLTKRLGELSQEQRARGRDFDRVEMRDGGNVHRLILALVNGG